MTKIEFETTLDDKPIKVTVRKPAVAAREKARLVDAKAFREAIEAGALRRNQIKTPESPEQIQRILELQQRLAEAARKIPDEKGKVREKGVTKEIAKQAAIQMRFDRLELQGLASERGDVESRTAEGIAQNAAFDYLVSVCSFKEDGSPVFESLDDYKERANRDEDVALKCAMNFALLDRGLDPEWQKKLPENLYLEKIEFFKDNSPAGDDEVFDLVDDAPPQEAVETTS